MKKNKYELQYPIGDFEFRKSKRAFSAAERAFGRPSDIRDLIKLQPEIIHENDRVTYRSLIKFKILPESRPLLDQLKATKKEQVLWDDAPQATNALLERPVIEKGVCRPSIDDGYAVLDIKYTGPETEEWVVKLRHDSMTEAHLRGLRESHGEAEIIAPTSV